ncbi:lytic transglycosylase domain-containing protein [Novosphingobium sp.]|uniref:lytic transglycosylase domain-containing protein n=1 Tax=Novosphingobium sp. TaxID=1874826 RepID=UPI002732C8F2|nr:lytic transglycosylase domain-containing protein [Novosphingobium sp.]MDP3905625.1 lytic transglycosylase domain-containing protein [Novosphingobium sp.]
MSSMQRKTIPLLLVTLAIAPGCAWAQDGGDRDGADWDRARSALVGAPATTMAQAISRWKLLSASERFTFADYSGFMLSYPGFPEEPKLRNWAERALDRESIDPARTAGYFDRFPPVTNAARAHHALALFALNRPEALTVARAAWRGGAMSDAAEATISARIAHTLTPDDHDTRMDALLWAGAAAQAERQLLYVSAAARPRFLARMGLTNGTDPNGTALQPGADALRDPGYLYNRARMLRLAGRQADAVSLLAYRAPLAAPPQDVRKWIAELLANARRADAGSAARIAASVDDAFAPGADVSRESFQIRDDYTSLMWLGGTMALDGLNDGARAAPLFWRYGAAARTPQTRTKGFYWAGRAMAKAGNPAEANRYFELAAAFPDQFYGMLALERLGRALPAFNNVPGVIPTRAEREAFNARALTQAVREVARESDWPTGVRFFREIANQAETEAEHVLVADLARELGRRDLGVILAQAAHTDGFGDFQKIGFPLIPIPQGGNWTMIHAITRQESQFAMNAVSHAGARGLMQLMPGTAREQAGKLELAYDQQALTRDAGYNITLGNAYFARVLDYFGGSYPLAVAAYNAGPGNVNKWLRLNGDPRNGSIDWIDWVERIPLTETRGYVKYVLENAVVYEAMHPARARMPGPNPLSRFIGKRQPG